MNSVKHVVGKCWMARNWKSVKILGGVLVALLFCLPAFSQGSFGRILGTVTDQSGGVVAGAAVTVIDTERGVTRSLVTDDAGAYNAPNLTPGNYTVRAEAKGFKRIERQGVGIEVGHEVRVDLTLQPGEQNQTVTVTESVPLVETTNATMGGTLENTDIIDLPLNGRDYQNLLALRPGVQLYPGGGPWTQSANGTRPDESVWMVDGVINFNAFDARPVENMPSPFTDGATILPIDAIQEFNLQENPKAEYGWKTGAIVNVGLKSGTNSLHGSAYAFGRDGSWDARNYYNVAPVNGVCSAGSLTLCNQFPVELKQFGATAGGRIKKDKLFWFAGYEGLRDSISIPFTTSVPATASLGGDAANSMVDAINRVASQLGAAAVSTVSLKLLCPNAVGQSFPFAGPCSGGLTPNLGTQTNFLSAFPNVNQSDNGIGKIDWHVNDKNLISGSLFVGNYTSVGEDRPFTNQLFEDNAPIRVWSNTDSWVYTPTSEWVNEMRFGYNRVSFLFTPVDANTLADGKGYPINTGITNPGGLPTITIGTFKNAGANTLGTNFNRPQTATPNPYYDFQDSISWLRGKHAFKFGGEYAHLEADVAIFSNGRGTINFSKNGGKAFTGSTALEDFFAGTPSSALVEVGNPKRSATWTSAAGYIQDDYRATQKLMINLGVRYEDVAPIKMKNDAWANFIPSQGLVQQNGPGLSTLWAPDHMGFEPRIGFAWDTTGKGTTVIRGGATILRATWPLDTFMAAFGLQNDNATSPAANNTAARLVCSAVSGVTCPATPGGTNSLGVASITGGAGLAYVTNHWNDGAGAPGIFSSPNFTSLACGDGVGSDPGPCDAFGITPNLRTPYVFNYNLGVTHAFGSNLSLEVEYVGNHGYRLLNFADINQAPLGAGYCLNSLTAAQLADACSGGAPAESAALVSGGVNTQAVQEARPFFTKYPYLGFINYVTNRSYSKYNSLQVSLTKRMSHGLSLNVGYTYAHGLDNGSLNRFGLLPQDSNNPGAEYGNSDFDIRHRLTATATYNIPGIKGFAQLLEGWQINTIVTFETGQPWTVFDQNAADLSGVGESGSNGNSADRWDIFGNPLDFPSGKNSIPYCTGFNGTNAGNTSANVTCGLNNPYGGVFSNGAFVPQVLSGSATNAAATLCQGSAPDPTTLAVWGCYPSANGKSVIAPQGLGTFGNMGRNIFRDTGFKNWDLSIFKNFTFKERYTVQARVEGFNILNHPTVGNPYGSSSAVNANNGLGSPGLGATGGTPDIIAGNPLIGSGGNRDIQIGLKLTF